MKLAISIRRHTDQSSLALTDALPCTYYIPTLPVTYGYRIIRAMYVKSCNYYLYGKPL